MTTVAIALGSADDENAVAAAIREAGCALIDGPEHDPETAAGRARASEIFGWRRLLFVSLSSSDRTSEPLCSASFQRFLEDREGPLERLVRSVAGSPAKGTIHVVCCFEWDADGEITLYKGDADALAGYLRLNGGPWRLTYPLGRLDAPAIDLDTPLVWRLVRPA